MDSDAVPDVAPPEFESIIADIEKSNRAPNEDVIHNTCLKRCMNYLAENAPKRPFFSDKYMYPISTYYLLIFSFPGIKNEKITNINQYMVKSLESSEECIRCFNNSICKARETFLVNRGAGVHTVEEFISVIYSWHALRLEETLTAFVESLQEGYVATEKDKNAMLECVMGPQILYNHPRVRKLFGSVLERSRDDILKFLTPKSLPPGIIFFLFEGTTIEKAWTEKFLQQFRKQETIYSAQTLDSGILLEFDKYFYRIQSAEYFNDQFCIQFWSNLSLLLEFLDKSAVLKLNKPKDIEIMSKYKDLTFYPLLRVLFNNIMASQDRPLESILIAFNRLLQKLGNTFWSWTSPYIAINYLDPILNNPNFGKNLRSNDASQKVDNLLGWCSSFIQTLSGSQLQTLALRLCNYLISVLNSHDIPTTINEISIAMNRLICSILIDCFTKDDKTDFHEKSFSVNVLKKRDVRAFVDNNAIFFVKLATQDGLLKLADRPLAIELISKCISYDITSLAHNSSLLKTGTNLPTSFDIFPLFWERLLQLPIYSNPALIEALVYSLKYVSSVIKFSLKKTVDGSKEMAEAIKQHNSNVTHIFNLIANLLDKIGMADSNTLKQMLLETKFLISFWSCVFSPYVNQSSLNILYEVFDAAGRFEAIKSVLKVNFKPTLVAITDTLEVLTKLSVYEPCPKTMRIMMDVVNSISNPLNGILAVAPPKDCETEIQQLWQSSWNFLIMVYEKTLQWASFYHLEELIEFTRDTLDLSHSLLDSFRLIVGSLPGDSKAMAHTLFEQFMQAFNHVIIWLRLGDTSLLSSCVELVFKGFDLAKDLDFSVDREFITTFVKFGARAKKFNNKLNEQQRADIIVKASEFDTDLVQEVLAESRKSKTFSKASESGDQQAKADVLAAFKYQTHQKPVKQQTLARFGVVTHEPPVAPAPSIDRFKPSNLEAMRKELKSTRAPVPKSSTVAPAAPRPAGFNSKSNAPVIGRSLNTTRRKRNDDDSSDEDDNEDVDMSDLFVDKKKTKAKVVEIDFNGRPVVRSAPPKRLIQQKSEEECMRLRLNVNLKPLYTTILKWNYNSTNEYPGEDKSIYTKTKDSYSDFKDYAKVTEPLLMLECWQGIQSAKLTKQEQPFELLIGSRASCDGFFDVYASIKKVDVNEKKISDSDLLVLGCNQTEMQSDDEVCRFLKAPSSQTCLAKVREIKSTNADFCDITLRVYPQGSMMGILTPKSLIVSMRVMQMVTIEREYSSLKALPYYDLGNEILEAKPTKPEFISEEKTRELVKVHDVNESQAKAILGSYSNEGFTLIQGPPGTGKTKTILGIVGYSLSQDTKSNAIQVLTKDGDSPTPEGSKGPKVLVCAPSNAAVDELVLRLREGVKNCNGQIFNPKVVRLGRSDAVNAAVRDLTLEELLDNQLRTQATKAAIDPNIRIEHTKCLELRDKYREELKSPGLTSEQIGELETKLLDVNKKRNTLAKKLDEQRENVSIAFRTKEIERRKLQAKILTEAQIICSTLSGSAHDFLSTLSMKFDQVIIDEACQCVELSALIPLRYGCKKCVMVGDPNQLPPTVLSQAAASYNYEQSLFVRMQKNHPDSVHLLDVQYRMHPEISKFPSLSFYDSKLKDGANMLTKNERPWHKEYPLTPYRFFDIVGKHQKNELSRSLFNYQEAKVTLELVAKLMQILPDNKFKGRIGIISPYKEQIRVLKEVFRKKYGQNILNEIDFNTVDGFQGQEKEIIIMSCVRASETGNVGFLSDVRRMNVALTRARTTLWILGNAQSLRRNKVWNELLADAQQRNCITQATPGFLDYIKFSAVMEDAKEPKSVSSTPGQIVEESSKDIVNPPDTSLEATTEEALCSKVGSDSQENNEKPNHHNKPYNHNISNYHNQNQRNNNYNYNGQYNQNFNKNYNKYNKNYSQYNKNQNHKNQNGGAKSSIFDNKEPQLGAAKPSAHKTYVHQNSGRFPKGPAALISLSSRQPPVAPVKSSEFESNVVQPTSSGVLKRPLPKNPSIFINKRRKNPRPPQ